MSNDNSHRCVTCIWVQLFNLSEDTGIQFRAEEVHVCGDVWRIKFLAQVDWHFMTNNGEGDHIFQGKEYIDISISCQVYDGWKVVPMEEAIQWYDQHQLGEV